MIKLAKFAAALFAALTVTGMQAAAQEAPPKVTVDADGSVHIPPMVVPPSSLLTPEGKAYLAQHLHDMQDSRSKILPDNGVVPYFLQPYLDYDHAHFAYDRAETRIAGVRAYIYTPRDGVKPTNTKRILLNLHGGGFGGCFPGCAELESIPIASMGRIKVISIDYREGPDHKFPAASEDVAAVYRELLKTYRPQDIGIYGCSAGGMLVGMSLAWFDKERLPMPGAAGIFCAGMTLVDGPGFGGDAQYVVSPIGEAYLPTELPPPAGKSLPRIGYLADVDIHDPLAAPANSLDLLSRFPPTLFITATRGFEFSSAVYSHGQMVKAGAQAELHVWDGMFHGFFYNSQVPESLDADNVIIKFFEKHLGG